MKTTKYYVSLCMALASMFLLLAGCQYNPPPASEIQLHGKIGPLSNLTWISVDVNLTPLNSNEAVLDSIFLTAGIDVPACGFGGGIEISVYSNGSLVWERSAQQKVAFVQVIPTLFNKQITVKPDSRVVVARGHAYIQLDYGILVGTTKRLADGTEYCTFFPDLPDVPNYQEQMENWSPGMNLKINTYSQGSFRLDIPSANDISMPEPTSTNVIPVPETVSPNVINPPQECQAPSVIDLSFNTDSPAMIGTIVDIYAKANWNSCFRAMRLKIDNNVVFELGQPSFIYSWNTSGYSAGNHAIHLEVAAQGDNSWSNPSTRDSTYTLQGGATATPVPCTAPPIEDLSFNPSSATVGITVNIHAKATWNSCFRAVRLKIDGGIVYELGSSEFTYSWNTSGYRTGNHTVRLEVAALGDNSWSSPTTRDANYTLQAGATATPVPCAAPPIEDLSFNPSSATVGTTVNIHAKATWNSCFRAVRLKIDGGIVYELGSSEFTYSWNTSGYSASNHTIRLEVAALGDNSWSNPTVRESGYSLQAGATATPVPCTAPPIEDLSFNPSSATVGTTVNIHAKATWNNCFRAMRLKIDGGIVYELGSPEFTYNWNSSGYSTGNHAVRLEVAAQGDNSWNYPSNREASYALQSGATATPVPCTAPPIEDLSFDPSSATVGTIVNVHAKATWNSCFRAMRLKIDGGIVYELGSPEFTYNWNTSGYSAGNHSVRLEVAALGDNSWSNPSTRDATYTLQSGGGGLAKPSLVSPSNGALLPPGTDVTLQWNGVSGATQYLVEIWGGQYGGTHNTPCGWTSGTSCHIGIMSPGNVLWRVQAKDGGGNLSPWSDEWNFTPQ